MRFSSNRELVLHRDATWKYFHLCDGREWHDMPCTVCIYHQTSLTLRFLFNDGWTGWCCWSWDLKEISSNFVKQPLLKEINSAHQIEKIQTWSIIFFFQRIPDKSTHQGAHSKSIIQIKYIACCDLRNLGRKKNTIWLTNDHTKWSFSNQKIKNKNKKITVNVFHFYTYRAQS